MFLVHFLQSIHFTKALVEIIWPRAAASKCKYSEIEYLHFIINIIEFDWTKDW